MSLMLLAATVTLEGQVSKVDTAKMQMGMHASMVRIQVSGDERWVVVGPSHWLESQGFELAEGDSVKVEAAENPMGFLMAVKVYKLEDGKWVEWTIRDEKGRPAWMGQGMGMPGMGRGH